jgi:hypothetical protein
MVRSVLLLWFLLLSLNAESLPKQILSPQSTLEELAHLKRYAIVLGKGPKEVHSFIDPYCSFSQKYLEYLYENNGAMLKKYTVYLYLYELKRKNSGEIIQAILSSTYKESMLKQVMLNNEEIALHSNDESEKSVELIRISAEKIGVFKRPYIIINGRVL